MIKNFFVENFKTFAMPTTINIDDLLIIAGSNSGGKSTLIQALLLLAQTLQNPRTDVALDLGGKYIQFAEFSEIVYGRPNSLNAGFTIGFDVETNETDIFSEELFFQIVLRRRLSTTRVRYSSSLEKTNSTHVSITFSSSRTGTSFIQKALYKKDVEGFGTVTLSLIRERGTKYRTKITLSPETHAKKISSKDILNRFEKTFVEADSQTTPRSKYRATGSDRMIQDPFFMLGFEVSQIPSIGNELEKILKDHPESRLELEDLSILFLDVLRFAFQEGLEYSVLGKIPFDHFLLPQARMTMNIDQEMYPHIQFFDLIFGQAIRDIRKFLRGVRYIGPLRAKPERAYLAIGSPIDMGNAGENTMPILWLYQNDKVQNKTLIGGKPSERKLVLAVRDWLQEFGIAYSFNITKPKRVIYQAELESAPGSDTMVTIADVGFGVSQLLPVIVASLRAPEGSTLILEQPEIHLHPRLQGKLADFLICMVELGKKVIVETHSEHLINMLRLRIIQDKSGDLKNKVGIVFVRSTQSKNRTLQDKKRNTPKRGSYIEQLKVDKYGKIINWPPDFFPESTDLNEEILKAMMEKFSEGK